MAPQTTNPANKSSLVRAPGLKKREPARSQFSVNGGNGGERPHQHRKCVECSVSMHHTCTTTIHTQRFGGRDDAGPKLPPVGPYRSSWCLCRCGVPAGATVWGLGFLRRVRHAGSRSCTIRVRAPAGLVSLPSYHISPPVGFLCHTFHSILDSLEPLTFGIHKKMLGWNSNGVSRVSPSDIPTNPPPPLEQW